MFKSLDDLKKEEKEKKNKKTADSYTGGSSSGLAVENPDDSGKYTGDFNKILDKANQNKGSEIPKDKEKIKITLYKNGFCVDDGPFRPLGDQKNKEFMTDIEKGFVPQELVEKGYKDIVVALENKKYL
jgi:UBX domain-containing protein 1